MSYCDFNVGDLGPPGPSGSWQGGVGPSEGIIFYIDNSNPAFTRYWEVEGTDVVQGGLNPPYDGFIGAEPFQSPTPPHWPVAAGPAQNPAFGPCKVGMEGGAEWGYFGMDVTPILGPAGQSSSIGFGKDRSFIDYVYTWLPTNMGGMPQPPSTWSGHSYNYHFNPVDPSDNSTIAQWMYADAPFQITSISPGNYPHLQTGFNCNGVTSTNPGISGSECWFLPSMHTLKTIHDSIHSFAAQHNIPLSQAATFNHSDFAPLSGTYWTASWKDTAPVGSDLLPHEGAFACEIDVSQGVFDFFMRPRCHTYSVRRVRYWDCIKPVENRTYNYRDGSFKYWKKTNSFAFGGSATGTMGVNSERYQGLHGPGAAGSAGVRPFKELTIMHNAGQLGSQYSWVPPPPWGFDPFQVYHQIKNQNWFWDSVDSVIGFDIFAMILNGTDVLGNEIFNTNNRLNFHHNNPGPYKISIWDDEKTFLGTWQYDKIIALHDRYPDMWPGISTGLNPGYTHLHNDPLDQNMSMIIVMEGVTHVDCPHGNVVNYANTAPEHDNFRNFMGVTDMALQHDYFDGQDKVSAVNAVPGWMLGHNRITNSHAFIRFECPTITGPFEDLDTGPNTTPHSTHVVCIPNGESSLTYNPIQPTPPQPWYPHVYSWDNARGIIGCHFLNWAPGAAAGVGVNQVYGYPSPNVFNWNNIQVNPNHPHHAGTHFLWSWYASAPPTNPNMTWYQNLHWGYSNCRGNLGEPWFALNI